MAIRIALIGYGKIARDEHWPTIAADSAFELVALAGGRARDAAGPDVPRFADTAALLAWGRLDAVAICTPPGPRHAVARDCLAAGLHVLLEKPPTATLGSLADLVARAGDSTLFAAWHSQFAPAVPLAAAALAGRRVRAIDIAWHEDVRRWHPGQDWVLAAGGFGVLDAGINALSIVSRLVPGALLVEGATLDVPANRGAPIAATLALTHGEAEFDWRARTEECRRITITTDGGILALTEGGQALSIDGIDQGAIAAREYPPMYRRFADLIASGTSDVDALPLRAVADALLVGRVERGPAFDW